MKKSLPLFLTMLIGLSAAQFSSYWINENMPIESSRTIFGALHFTHVRNLGGVFGMAQGKGWVFMIISIIVLCALLFYALRAEKLSILEFFCYGMILSGGLSNILDRLIYGSVIDFIDVHGIPYWTYIFNTADVMIHIGFWPLLLSSFFNGKEHQATKP